MLLPNLMQEHNYTEGNTKAYTAVVSDVKVTRSGEQMYVDIYTEGNKTVLSISTITDKNMSEVDIEALYPGQTIEFRIDDSQEQNWGSANIINIVSLRAGSIDILTLEEYSVVMHSSSKTRRSFCVGIMILLIGIFMWSLYLVRSYKKK